MTDKQKQKADLIADYYGLKNQRDKTSEELDELKADLQDRPDIAPIEEIGDVYVMLCQMRRLYHIEDAVLSQWIDYKLDRTLEDIAIDEDE